LGPPPSGGAMGGGQPVGNPQQQSAVRLGHLPPEALKLGQKMGVGAGQLALCQVEQRRGRHRGSRQVTSSGIEQPVKGNVQGSGKPLQSGQGGSHVSTFDPGDVAPVEAGLPFDVALGEVPLLAQLPQPLTDVQHRSPIGRPRGRPRGARRRTKVRLRLGGRCRVYKFHTDSKIRMIHGRVWEVVSGAKPAPGSRLAAQSPTQARLIVV